MPTVRDDVVIDLPAEKVAEFISDPTNMALYDVNIIECKQDSPGERGKGSRDRGIARLAGKKLPFVTEIVEWEPMRAFYRTVEAPMQWTMDFSVEPIDAKHCRVVEELHSDDLSGVFKFGNPVMARMVAHDLKATLSNLKVLLEESSVGHK